MRTLLFLLFAMLGFSTFFTNFLLLKIFLQSCRCRLKKRLNFRCRPNGGSALMGHIWAGIATIQVRRTLKIYCLVIEEDKVLIDCHSQAITIRCIEMNWKLYSYLLWMNHFMIPHSNLNIQYFTQDLVAQNSNHNKSHDNHEIFLVIGSKASFKRHEKF